MRAHPALDSCLNIMAEPNKFAFRFYYVLTLAHYLLLSVFTVYTFNAFVFQTSVKTMQFDTTYVDGLKADNVNKANEYLKLFGNALTDGHISNVATYVNTVCAPLLTVDSDDKPFYTIYGVFNVVWFGLSILFLLIWFAYDMNGGQSSGRFPKILSLTVDFVEYLFLITWAMSKYLQYSDEKRHRDFTPPLSTKLKKCMEINWGSNDVKKSVKIDENHTYDIFYLHLMFVNLAMLLVLVLILVRRLLAYFVDFEQSTSDVKKLLMGSAVNSAPTIYVAVQAA